MHRCFAVERLTQCPSHEYPDELAFVGGRATDVRYAFDDVGRRVACARQGLVIDRRAGSACSDSVSRIAFSVAALTTTRAEVMVDPSRCSETATPSAGQSSAEPVVTFM